MREIVKLKEFEKLDKAELQQLGKSLARAKMDEGYSDAVVLTVLARKAVEYLSSYAAELNSDARAELESYDNNTADIYGAKLELSSTGHRLDYEADPVYSELQEKLKQRQALLKIAYIQNEAVFDSAGKEVPKVPIKTQSKEVLKVKI